MAQNERNNVLVVGGKPSCITPTMQGLQLTSAQEALVLA